jgi:mRNA-degrading endonuclease RelE of RelBE toxin-antitoxin system
VFRPTLAELVVALKTDPKRFPKKHGRLSSARAAPLTFRGTEWRAVFTLDEEDRTVTVWALGPHDRAYEEAARRIP